MRIKDKKGFIIFLVILVIAIIAIPVTVRMLRELIEIYKFNFDLIPKNYMKKIILDYRTYTEFIRFDNPINVIGVATIGWYILSYIIGVLGLFKIHETYEQTDDYGSHGTSRWQTVKEMKVDYYNGKQGWFLGSVNKEQTYNIDIDAAYHTIDNRTKLNMQIVVIGPPGSDKTTGFVLPNIYNLCNAYRNLDEKPDLIITDPKPELYPLTGDYLEKNGYEIKILDFTELKHGDCLNVIDFIHDDKTLMEIAQGYIESIESANGGKASGDTAFWNNQESQVLAALMGFVKQVYPKEKQNFTEIAKILTSEDVCDTDSAKDFFINNRIKGAPLQLWNNFLMLADSERTRANILGGLAEKLKLFAIEDVQNVTSKTTIDITRLGVKKEKPMAVFIFMPVSDKTYMPIINTCINIMFKQLYKTAYKTKNRLEWPVYFIIEEMANIGKIPGIQEMLGTMRGARIYPMMIWQSLSQMKDRYGEKGFEDIMSMCDTTVYLGINDQFTAKYCSENLGDTTIKVQGISRKANDGILTIDSKSESQNYLQRKLLLPDECKRLDNSKLILIQRAKNPALLYKVQYKYWEYSLCETKSVFELKEIEKYNNESENYNTNNSVINMTLSKDIVKDFDKDIKIDNFIESNIVEDKENENKIEENEFNLENVELNLDELKAFTVGEDMDIEI